MKNLIKLIRIKIELKIKYQGGNKEINKMYRFTFGFHLSH